MGTIYCAFCNQEHYSFLVVEGCTPDSPQGPVELALCAAHYTILLPELNRKQAQQ